MGEAAPDDMEEYDMEIDELECKKPVVEVKGINPAGTVRTMYVHCTYFVPTVRTMYVHCTYSARWELAKTNLLKVQVLFDHNCWVTSLAT